MSRIFQIDQKKYPPNSGVALVILGDAGINYYLNKTDVKNKKSINHSGYRVYIVRGNHEERPENIEGMKRFYDSNIENDVYMEDEFPEIRYLIDGESYSIGGFRCLVIGGAYSVDKFYRLSQFPEGSEWTGWFKDEQLTADERNHILNKVNGKEYDMVLSHTCPLLWEPTDLFLPGVKQDKVDKSMEIWMETVKNHISYKVWCFGHYHQDRLERPGVIMMYHSIIDQKTIADLWNPSKRQELMKYIKAPNYYIDANIEDERR